MEKIIVSACLLGIPCRYDGKSKPVNEVISLQEKYELIPICAETLGGLPIPRVPAEIVGNNVIRKDGVDVTYEYNKGANEVLRIAIQNGCTKAILKAKSPSCGKGQIYDGTYSGVLTEGNGVLTDLLIKNNIKVYTETEIDKI